MAATPEPRHNIAFGAQPGVLWVGAPSGTLVEIDLDNQHAVERDVLAGSPVTALIATPAGDLVVAAGEGDLVLVSVLAGSAKARAADVGTPQALAAAFLDDTSKVPGDGDLVPASILPGTQHGKRVRGEQASGGLGLVGSDSRLPGAARPGAVVRAEVGVRKTDLPARTTRPASPVWCTWRAAWISARPEPQHRSSHAAVPPPALPLPPVWAVTT